METWTDARRFGAPGEAQVMQFGPATGFLLSQTRDLPQLET